MYGGKRLPVLRYAQFFEDQAQGAEPGEAELKEVGADKKSEEKEVFVDKKGIVAAIHAQCHAEHDKKSGQGVNPVIDYHDVSPCA
jgi:hypothetical protein